uniref:Uncharacterized protein n=1 Tax=Kalanchoe fedtschenkoi TaxID=63787 RepID=A0A7N0VBI4_KALFE
MNPSPSIEVELGVLGTASTMAKGCVSGTNSGEQVGEDLVCPEEYSEVGFLTGMMSDCLMWLSADFIRLIVGDSGRK